MKKILSLALISVFVIVFSNCKKEDTTADADKVIKAPTANISISLRKLASETEAISCNGLSVELHSNSLYTAKVKSTTSSGTATAATASMPNVPNGKYYLIAWKDVDGSNSYSNGDFFGFVETPVLIDGVAKSYTIDIYKLKE